MRALQESVGAAARHLWLLRNKGAFAESGPSRPPRLFVDVSVIVKNDAGTGIQRVVRSVWSHLKALSKPGFEIVPVYATRAYGYCYAPADFLSKDQRLGLVPVGVKKGDCFLGLDLAAQQLPKWRRQIDAWRAEGATVHVVVYDLLPLQRRQWFSPALSRNFEQWFHTLTETADQALCISEQVRADLREMIAGTPAARRLLIGRVHLGADIVTPVPSRGQSTSVTAVLDRARDRPFILMVGTVEPRKAYDQALAAFDHLWTSGAQGAPDLVIVGRPGWKTRALQRRLRSHPYQGQRLHWLPNASDEELSVLYERCHGLFLATHGEGFGLPVIEAALHGRHALVRDLPVFREKRLSNLLYFVDDKPGALAKKLIELVRAPQSAAPGGTLPSWAECANEILSALDLPHRQANAGTAKPKRQVA